MSSSTRRGGGRQPLRAMGTAQASALPPPPAAGPSGELHPSLPLPSPSQLLYSLRGTTPFPCRLLGKPCAPQLARGPAHRRGGAAPPGSSGRRFEEGDEGAGGMKKRRRSGAGRSAEPRSGLTGHCSRGSLRAGGGGGAAR